MTKFNSFQSLANAVNGERTTPDKWKDFLKENGHSTITFNYLPEDLKTHLKFAFAKKLQQY